MRLVGLYRELEYSPGRHRSNDAQLIELVAEALANRGCRVELLTLAGAVAGRESAAMLFSMCQGRVALETLGRWELEGARIVNRPAAALNSYRDRLPGLMGAAGLPFPETTIVATGRPVETDAVARNVAEGIWLKRGDVHASVSADVQWVDSLGALREGLREFASRGITLAALQRHRPGDEIKFYGVAGGAFFHWFFLDPATMSPPVDEDALRRLADDAAAATGLEIFGGDVIVGPSGELTLIDLNDWPSFAPCRGPAAAAIADYLVRRADASWNPALVSGANQSAL